MYYHLAFKSNKELTFSFTEDGIPNEIFSFFTHLKQSIPLHLHAYAILPNAIHILSSSNEVLNKERLLTYILSLETSILRRLPEIVNQEEINKYNKSKIFDHNVELIKVHTKKGVCTDIHDIHFDPVSEKYAIVELPADYLYSSIRQYITGNGMYPVDVLPCKNSY